MYSLQKRADHVIATIPCSVVEYVHYSRAIEEKRNIAQQVPSKCRTHLRSAYLIISIFLHDTCTLMLDVPRDGKRMNKAHVKKEWKNIDSRRPRRSKEPRGGASALIIFNIIQRYKINQSSPQWTERVRNTAAQLVQLHHTSTWLTHAITIFLGFRATPISSNPAACIASPSSSLSKCGGLAFLPSIEVG